MLAVLERFPGYTYGSLMAEDAELIRLLNQEAVGAEESAPDDEGW